MPAAAVKRGGLVLFGMTRRKGHVGGFFGALVKAISSTDEKLLTSINLSKIEVSGISCVEIKFIDMRRKAKSEGNLLVLY